LRGYGKWERMFGGGSQGGSVAVELGRIFDGAVVVDLAPVVIEEAIDAGGAEGKFGDGGGSFQAAAFATNGVEKLAGNVERIAAELDGDADGTGKEAFVDAANFRPTALDAADGIVHGDVVERGPILTHEHNVSGVEGAVELNESVTRMSEIAKIFETGDRVKSGRKSG
jgi:hypothetical protein